MPRAECLAGEVSQESSKALWKCQGVEGPEVAFQGGGKTEGLAEGPLVFLQELWRISPGVPALAGLGTVGLLHCPAVVPVRHGLYRCSAGARSQRSGESSSSADCASAGQ